MFPPDNETIVEVIEQWSESESGDEIETKGAIDEVLISTYAFLQLIEQSVADNEEPTVNGLLRTSLKMAQEGDTQMMSFLFRMMATGLDSGMFQLGDD